MTDELKRYIVTWVGGVVVLLAVLGFLLGVSTIDTAKNERTQTACSDVGGTMYKDLCIVAGNNRGGTE